MDARNAFRSVKTDTASLILNPRFIGPCIAGLFCLTVATVLGVSYLFTMATVLLALPVAGYTIGTIMLRACTISREPLVITTQGEIASIAVQIKTSLGSLPTGFAVHDKLPKWIEAEDNAGFKLYRNRSVEMRTSVKALRRGKYSVGPAVIFAADPLEMFKLKRHIPGLTELIVHPKPVPFRINRLLSGDKGFEHTNRAGHHASRGSFAGVREYRFGDELKRVHWKTTARTQHLSVMEFEDATIGAVTIMLDLSSGSDYGAEPATTLDVAAGATAFALRECLKYKRPARLLIPNETGVQSIDIHSPGSLTAALTELSGVEANSPLGAMNLIRSCSGGADAILITTQATEKTSAAAIEAQRRGIKLVIALVDPEPFGKHFSAGLSAIDLARSGANVELIREATLR